MQYQINHEKLAGLPLIGRKSETSGDPRILEICGAHFVPGRLRGDWIDRLQPAGGLVVNYSI